MPYEIGREFCRDDEIDRFAICLRQVNQPPKGSLRQQLLFGVPLERNRHSLGAHSALAQLLNETLDVQLGASMHQRHLGVADKSRPDRHVANLKLMISPS